MKKKFFTRSNAVLCSYFIFWFAYFLRFWSLAITFDAAGDLFAGNINVWGDWALHFTLGSAMAYRRLLLMQSPLLLGAPLTYPIVADFLSAILIRLGVPFFRAFTIPSFVMSLAVVAALFYFYATLFRSRRAAILSSAIFLFNGGLGIVDVIAAVAKSRWFSSIRGLMPHPATRIDGQVIKWMSVIDSMIVPQRAFVFGFPLAVLALALVFRALVDARSGAAAPAGRRIFAAGAAYGILPVVHPHSFLALSVVLAFWCAGDVFVRGRNWWRETGKAWAALISIAAILAVPASLGFVLRGDRGAHMLRWFPGWYARESSINWFLFWWRNWGFTPFAAFAGLMIFVRDHRWPRARTFFFFAPFLALFVALNLVLFQPWVWDNTKLLVWVSLGTSGLAGVFVERLFRGASIRLWLGAALLAALTASGAYDAARLLVPSLNSYQMYSSEDLFLADWVRKNSDRNSIWMTAHQHNNWLFNLTGRRALMAYEGWLWTHGYSYQRVKLDLEKMFRQPDDDLLFRRYGVTYAVVGPEEEAFLGANKKIFDARFPIAMKTEHTTIYSITGIARAPASKSFRAMKTSESGLRAGLIRKIYQGRYFSGQAETEREILRLNFHFDDGQRKPFPTPGSIEWNGYVKAPRTGDYTFLLSSDDGSWLFIDEQLVIDNGGEHGDIEKSATLHLEEGLHRLELKYFDAGGGAILRLDWVPPGQAGHPVEDDAVWYSGA